MVLFRSTLFAMGYVVLTVTYGTLSVFAWLLPPLQRHKVITSWTTLIVVWMRVCCGVRHRVIGRKNLPRGAAPCVILSKHQSAWETLYLQTLFWPAATVLKKELLRIPFFGWGLLALKPIAIDRSNPRNALRQVKKQGIHRLSEGLNVILFPEGTRMAPGERGNYARSGADMAKSAGMSIVPVALNTAKCWPSGSFLKYPGLVTVSVGPIISTEDKTSKQIMAEVESWIEAEMPRLEDY